MTARARETRRRCIEDIVRPRYRNCARLSTSTNRPPMAIGTPNGIGWPTLVPPAVARLSASVDGAGIRRRAGVSISRPSAAPLRQVTTAKDDRKGDPAHSAAAVISLASPPPIQPRAKNRVEIEKTIVPASAPPIRNDQGIE